MKIALFPGSFDPFTKGHHDIVKRGVQLFDRVVIGIGRNTSKQTNQTVEERCENIAALFADESRVSVRIYDTLTVDFAKEIGAQFILRGVRNATDFEYEQQIAYVNKRLTGVETVLLFSDAELATISSSLVRELQTFGKDVSEFLPQKR